MPRKTAVRQYGKSSARSKAERMFAELPQSPVRKQPAAAEKDDAVNCLSEQLSVIEIEEQPKPRRCSPRKSVHRPSPLQHEEEENRDIEPPDPPSDDAIATSTEPQSPHKNPTEPTNQDKPQHEGEESNATLRVLGWEEVCPSGDRIVKIAEASYAEVYRVTNERGTSIIKVIRLDSPIKPLTKQQIRARLVDEEPHSEQDIHGELQISEWLADIPGFVVYKERYVVQGKTTAQLLETHQAFQRRAKRKDPGRAQFYPSPSRYFDDTRFLVVELGDAGTSLEDWKIRSESELWDIFFLQAIALARAEDLAMFEHRDLHEGNLCIKQARPPRERSVDQSANDYFGHSGLDITILDYGLSRAEDLSIEFAQPVAYDLDKDLSLFTSTHAPQCKVYRQMRSFLLRADRTCLPPEQHNTPHAKGIDGPLTWDAYAPYTNVLWLAYLYDYTTTHFAGEKKAVAAFKRETKELWKYLNPDAAAEVPCFGSAADVVCFGVEAGWVREEQLMGAEASAMEREDSIILSRDDMLETATNGGVPRRRTRQMARLD